MQKSRHSCGPAHPTWNDDAIKCLETLLFSEAWKVLIPESIFQARPLPRVKTALDHQREIPHDMTDDPSTTDGVLLSSDLFFSSKITGAAGALGLQVRVLGQPSAVSDAFSDARPRFLIVDLSLPGLNVGDLAASLPDDNRPEVIAYDAHVRTDQLAAAKAAGCDAVLSRGQLDAQLPQILGRFAPE